MRTRWIARTAVLLCAATGCLALQTPDEPLPLTGPSESAVGSVRVLCQLLGRDVTGDVLLRAAAGTREREAVSVDELVGLGRSVGLELVAREASLVDLSALRRPAIVHLQDGGGRFAVLEYLMPTGGVLIGAEGAEPSLGVVTPKDLRKRYSGTTLVPIEARDPGAAVIGYPEVPLIKGARPDYSPQATVILGNLGGSAFEWQATAVSHPALTVNTLAGRSAPGDPTGGPAIELSVSATDLPAEPTPLVITCVSDIPDRPIFHIGLLARADDYADIEDCRGLRVRAGRTDLTAIRTWFNHPAHVLHAATDVDWAEATVSLEPSDLMPAKMEGSTQVRVLESAPLGRHTITVALESDSPYAPALSTGMVVDVYPPVTSAPSVLALDPGRRRESLLRWDPAEVVSYLILETENLDGCDVSYESTGDGEGRVTIVPPAGGPAEVTTGWVRLRATLASGLERIVGEVKVHLLPVDPFAPM